MKDFTSFFFILVCVSILYLYLENKAKDVTYVKIGAERFLVRNRDDKEDAAVLLKEVIDRLQKIVDYVCSDKNRANNKNDLKMIESFERLNKNFRPDNITESSPGNSYTSYSINKGEKIVFCLRAKDEEQTLEPINTLMFVAIHELAHLQTESVGHTDEFWKNMKYLLEVAIKLNLYKHHDYYNKPVSYCGVKITDSPLHD